MNTLAYSAVSPNKYGEIKYKKTNGIEFYSLDKHAIDTTYPLLSFQANMKLRILVQLLVALMTGWAYAGIGNNAKFAISNYYFVLLTVLQFVFMCTLPMFAHGKNYSRIW